MARGVHRLTTTTSHEVMSDGRTVWVNAADGCCVGRFSKQGIDVHYGAEQQMLIGRQCLQCKKGPCDAEDWLEFRAAMRLHFNINVAEAHAPTFLAEVEAA